MQDQSLRAALVQTLKGQRFRVPDFDTIFEGWPCNKNGHLEWLRSEVDEHLHSVVRQRWPVAEREQVLQGLQKADFGLFGAFWWPQACPRTLKTMTLFVIWLFLWDDEIDTEVGALAADFNRAQRYREETLSYVEVWLGLTEVTEMPTHPNILISSFACIGKEVQAFCTTEERSKMVEEIKLYIDASEEEQRQRLSPELPSVKKYWQCRMGTSAVGACIGLLQYSHELLLPKNIMKDVDMIRLWDETNIIISGTNDILSLKKELKNGTPDSLVPILFQESASLETAIETAAVTVLEARKGVDAAAERLLGRYAPNTGLEEFIAACKANCTGNLHWSLLTGRYGLNLTDVKTHSVVVL